MKPQTAFNKMVEHLRKQGEKSRVGKNCRFRDENGLKCAVGCLIPDKYYYPAMEHEKVSEFATFKDWPGDTFAVMDTMQWVHDNNPPSRWETKFRKVAREHGLTLKEAV